MATTPAGEGRQRILAVAEELFTERGYQAVSIREIAQGCAVTNAALYYYFPSKAVLFDEVMEQHAERLNARMRRAGEKPSTYRAKVEVMLVEYAKVVADQCSPFFLMLRESHMLSDIEKRNPWGNLIHALLLPLEDVMQQAVQNDELQPLPDGYSPAALLIGMLHGQIQYRKACLGRSFTNKDVELVVTLFWEGLKVR